MILTFSLAAALAVQTNEARPPQRARGNLNQYFFTEDYPPTALARGAQGSVGFQLDVGADGAVTKCTITRSSNDAALDSATCAILLGRAHYEPARDAAGRAVRGSDEGRVTWRLPPAPVMRFARIREVSQLRSNGSGELSCAVTTNGVAETDVGPSRCGSLTGTGTDYMLRRAPAPTEVTMISVSGPASAGIEEVGEDEAGYGMLQYDVVVYLTIGQDGRITECRPARRNIPADTLASRPDLCGPVPPGAPPMFEPSSDSAPRRARYRHALYLKGWPVDPETPPAPAAPPRRPRR